MNKNGKEWITLDSGTAPMLIENRIFIPVRAVVECMGGEVLFYKDGNYDKIRIFVSDHDIQMWVGHSAYFVDGTENKFDSPPQIVGGRAVIPLRSVFESIGCTVTYEERHGRVTIGYVE